MISKKRRENNEDTVTIETKSIGDMEQVLTSLDGLIEIVLN